VGVEFALALDPGPTFAYRDANAVTRYDKIVQILKKLGRLPFRFTER